LVEFTGERVIPGQVDADLFNEHLARYVFAARLARGKRVLDAGCGSGYGSAELAKTALSVVGTDVADGALSYAREHFRLPNLHFEQASCTATPHADASFDLVVAFEVIEHLRDWRAFLLEVRRVLAPNGEFIVSTPNKLYYAESRAQAGPNPFHEHEFEFAEFRTELSSMFPYVALFLENHVAGVVFSPVSAGAAVEVRVDGAGTPPPEAHFFVAVCAHRPQEDHPAFVYVPSAANVLREREVHIALLEDELRQKNEWLQRAQQELARVTAELEERNRWAARLDRELEASGARICELQEEVRVEQIGAREAVASLEHENRAKTEWAERLNVEIEAKGQELARCVEYLNAAEKTVVERTEWAQRLQAKLDLLEASRWVRLGRKVGLGPEASVE
jgi:SAM-dependent methyltransferase